MEPRGLTVRGIIELMVKRGWKREADEGIYHQYYLPGARYPITIVGDPNDVLSLEAVSSIFRQLDEAAAQASDRAGRAGRA